MRKPSSGLPLLLTLAFAGSPGWVLGEPPARAFVLDSASHTLVALELPSGKRAGSLALQGHPEVLLQSPDGSRLVVLDRGPGEDKHERGYKATGKSSATIVDPVTLRVISRVELGSGLEAGAAYFSADSHRLTLLCPGYEAKNTAEAQARELVNLDLVAGRETGRVTLEPGTLPIGVSKDGQALPLIQGLPRKDRYPYGLSKLFVVDLAAPTVRAQIDMGGWSELHTDGERFYLLDPGRPDKSPEKNLNGMLQVVSLEGGTLLTKLEAGRGPRSLYPDEKGHQVFVLSEGQPGAAGELRAVRGDSLAATLSVAANPKLVVRVQDVVYVVGGVAVTLVDPVALQVASTIPLALGKEALVDEDDLPSELRVSPDGKRAFVYYGLDEKVAVLDLEARRAVGGTKIGRGGKKFLRGMARFNQVLTGGAIGNLMAGVVDPWLYGYAFYSAASREQARLVVRPDGARAFALNVQTKDVTVVDGATGKSVEMIGGAGYALEPLQGGRFLFEVSGSELRLIDQELSVKAAEIELPELRGLFFPPDRSIAVALAKQTVLVLDGATGKEIARLTDLMSPAAIVFDEASGRAEARVQP